MCALILMSYNSISSVTLQVLHCRAALFSLQLAMFSLQYFNCLTMADGTSVVATVPSLDCHSR